MSKYEIYTDSSCDLTKEMIEEFNLKVMQLEVHINDNPPVYNNEINIKSFYDELRNGANAKTNAVTPGQFQEAMIETLEAGNDILYIGFSSGLSATYANGVMIIDELKEKYPDRKILYTDTLCASVGQGLLVYYAAMLHKEGASIEEVLEKINSIKDKIFHQITVDDLFFLRRGGRLSTSSAVVGSVLKFKPIITMDKDGRLDNVDKVRGRKTSLKEMLNRMKETENLKELGYVFISHCDCIEDAEILKSMVLEQWSDAEIFICDIGPVIGAHLGPGGMAMCYLGKTIKC